MSTTGNTEDSVIYEMTHCTNHRGTRSLRDNLGHTYTYHFGRNYVDGTRVEWYRCDHYLACRGVAKLTNGVLSNRVVHGSHYSDCDQPERRIARRLEREAVKKSENLNIMPKQILDGLLNLPPEVLAVMSSRAQLHGRMKNRRAMIRKQMKNL